MAVVPFKIFKDGVLVEDFKSDNVYYPVDLLCGEISPVIPGAPRYIRFLVLVYVQDLIILLPSSLKISLPESENGYSLNIIKPGKFFKI